MDCKKYSDAINMVAKIVCNNFAIDDEILKSKTRLREVAEARHSVAYMCHRILRVPHRLVSEYFSWKDHTTSMHSERKAEELMDIDEFYKAVADKIKSEIFAGLVDYYYETPPQPLPKRESGKPHP